MSFLNSLGNLNWIAVFLAAASSFLVGFVWYHKAVFGKSWMKLVGITEEQINSSKGMARSFILTGIFSLLTAVTLSCLMYALAIKEPIGGLLFGACIGLVFRSGAHVIHNGFAQRSFRLTVIDGTHDIVAVALMGLILGSWL